MGKKTKAVLYPVTIETEGKFSVTDYDYADIQHSAKGFDLDLEYLLGNELTLCEGLTAEDFYTGEGLAQVKDVKLLNFKELRKEQLRVERENREALMLKRKAFGIFEGQQQQLLNDFLGGALSSDEEDEVERAPCQEPQLGAMRRGNQKAEAVPLPKVKKERVKSKKDAKRDKIKEKNEDPPCHGDSELGLSKQPSGAPQASPSVSTSLPSPSPAPKLKLKLKKKLKGSKDGSSSTVRSRAASTTPDDSPSMATTPLPTVVAPLSIAVADGDSYPQVTARIDPPAAVDTKTPSLRSIFTTEATESFSLGEVLERHELTPPAQPQGLTLDPSMRSGTTLPGKTRDSQHKVNESLPTPKVKRDKPKQVKALDEGKRQKEKEKKREKKEKKEKREKEEKKEKEEKNEKEEREKKEKVMEKGKKMKERKEAKKTKVGVAPAEVGEVVAQKAPAKGKSQAAKGKTTKATVNPCDGPSLPQSDAEPLIQDFSEFEALERPRGKKQRKVTTPKVTLAPVDASPPQKTAIEKPRNEPREPSARASPSTAKSERFVARNDDDSSIPPIPRSLSLDDDSLFKTLIQQFTNAALEAPKKPAKSKKKPRKSPRIESPQEESPRQESPRQESPRQESPRPSSMHPPANEPSPKPSPSITIQTNQE